MELGVGFNVFSGAELLKPALLNVRQFAKCVAVMYTTLSVAGTPAPSYLIPLLNDLKNQGLIDILIECPNEIQTDHILARDALIPKYEAGRKACIERGCTHYHQRDCDEFYNVDDFANLLKFDSDLLVSHIWSYVKSPTYRLKQREHFFVPTIQKIEFGFAPNAARLDFEISPERIPIGVKNYSLVDSVYLHHMVGVRYNQRELERKFEGHSFWMAPKKNKKNYIKSILELQEGSYDVVPDQFGILDYWEKEWYEN